MSYRTKGPRIVPSKFACICAETGKMIGRGDKALYYAATGKLYCQASNQYQQYLADPANHQLDPIVVAELCGQEGEDFRTQVAGYQTQVN